MKKFKGTKGEWKIFDYKGTGPVIDIVLGDQFGAIAQVYSSRETGYCERQNEEVKANARLICGSKRLLQALMDTNEIIGKLTDANLKDHHAKLLVRFDGNQKLINEILGS